METSRRAPYPVSEAVVRQRTDAATRHGGQSENRIKAVARAHKRRFLRQTGLKIGDLDGISLGLIDNWARAQSKVTILDEFFSEQGLIRNGEIDGALRVYFTGVNSARMALGRLAEHLAKAGEQTEDLDDYIDAAYGNGETPADP
jgi:hypothetical protein